MDPFLLVCIAAGLAGLLFLYFTLWETPHMTDQALAQARSPPSKSTQAAIDALSTALPGQLLFPGDEAFAQQIKSHWCALQREVIPAALVLPTSTAQVATVVKILAAHASASADFKFAIRSGGHAPNTESNVANGIVLDLKHLNFVDLSADKTSVDIGPSARWGQVYDKLALHNRAVTGGRASTVGVGGLTLGGGISFFSGRRGFVCDGVLEHELVTATGEVLICNATTNTDLHIALKGGGNNFGVVTRFKLRAFEHGPELWGGNIYGWPGMWSCYKYLDGLVKMSTPGKQDVDSSCILAFGHLTAYGGLVMPFTTCVNTAVTEEPESLKPMTRLPRVWSMTKRQPLSGVCRQVEDSAPPGKRAQWSVTTFEHDRGMIFEAFDIWKQAFPRAMKIKDFLWVLVLQPMYPSVTMHSETNGLGMKTDKTVMIVSINAVWPRREDDDTVYKLFQDTMEKIEETAQARNLWHKFKYVNYAAWWQQALRGVRDDKAELMHELSRKVDPQGIFQKACIGGKKLP